MLAFLNFI